MKITLQDYKYRYGGNPIAIRRDGKWIFVAVDEVNFTGKAFGTIADETEEKTGYLVNEECEVIV